MTTTKLKRLFTEQNSDLYFQGRSDALDILQKSLAAMPDQNGQLYVKDFMRAIETARQAFEIERRVVGGGMVKS